MIPPLKYTSFFRKITQLYPPVFLHFSPDAIFWKQGKGKKAEATQIHANDWNKLSKADQM